MKHLFCFLLIITCFLAHTQESKKIFSGQLLDSSTQEPILNAHIYSGTGGAAVSDYYGNFSVYVFDNDTLTVSCIGYQKTRILISTYKNFEDKRVIFSITPIIYALNAVEIPYVYSVVIVPEEKREKVEIDGVGPLKSGTWQIKLNDDMSIKFGQPSTAAEKNIPGVATFGPSIALYGFLSGLINKETKKEREIKEITETDNRTTFFDTYVKSATVKNILTEEPYKMSQNEYEKFIETFILDAGKIKFATNEYDILQKIIEKTAAQR